MRAFRWFCGLPAVLPLLGVLFVVLLPSFMSYEESQAFIPKEDVLRLLIGANVLVGIIGFIWSVRYLVPEDKRRFWARAIFVGNVLTMPLYWFLYVRPSETKE